MTFTGYIYKIVHTELSITYVGMTVKSIKERFNEHTNINAKRNKTSLTPYLLKHGVDAFHIELIKAYEVVDEKQLKVYETLWINKTKCINKTVSFNPARILCCNPFARKRLLNSK